MNNRALCLTKKRKCLRQNFPMQSAIRKLTEMEFIAVNDNSYSVSDIMMRLYITENMD